MAKKKKKDNPLEVSIHETDSKLAGKVKDRLLSAQNYKRTRGFYEDWAEYQRFWESDQWPSASQDTQNFPRPVTNHFAEIIEMKVAGLCYEPPEMYCEPKKGYIRRTFDVNVLPVAGEEDEPIFKLKPEELLAHMLEQVQNHNSFDVLVENFTRSSALLGNGILYTYWDNTVYCTGEGGFVGEIAAIEVDIADFFVGDPTEPEIQKQPYVIVTERRPLRQVREDYGRYSSNVTLLEGEAATRSTMTYDHEKTEQSETDYVDLVHCWERKVTKYETSLEDEDGNVVKRNKPQIDYFVVCQNYVLRKEEDFYLSKLYPFVNFPWYPRRKSFYGKAESCDLINNQKELNRLQGIALLGAYKAGLPNIVFKPGFVKREDIPVGPGGHIIQDDTPPNQGWGINYMQPPTIASYIPHLKDAMQQGMKDTSGVHEAWSGKAPSAHLNASAIMALQEAAGVRVRGIQRRMYQAILDLGKIWLGYMKQYYTEDRMYRVFGKNNVEGLAWFRTDKFKEMEFDVKVTMGSASPYSKTVVASTLENMLERGVIDGDLYKRMLPPEVFPAITKLIELSEDRMEEQRMMMLNQQLAIIDEIVAQTIEQARASGVPISPEAIQQMKAMIVETAREVEGEAQ